MGLNGNGEKQETENFKKLWAAEFQVYDVSTRSTVFNSGKVFHSVEKNNVCKVLIMKWNFKENLSGSCFNGEIL